ncbi:MAG: hypothetical protein IJB68_09515 [Ruminococcus sp.]|nr:hypothetical protein [Ruminococcus sp.]
MKRKILSLFLCSVMLAGVVSGCGTDTATTDTSPSSSTVEETTEAPTVQVTEAEYKTMEPPEEGWTIEKLMSVTYICGKQLTYPLTVDDLPNEVGLDMENAGYARHCIAPMNINSEYFGNCVIEVNEKNESTGMIESIIVDEFTSKITNNIVVNGITIGSTERDLYENLGEPNEVYDTSINTYKYYYDLQSKTKIISISVDCDDKTISEIRLTSKRRK